MSGRGRPRVYEQGTICPTELILDKDLQMRVDIPSLEEYTTLIQEADGVYCFDRPVRVFLIKGKHYVVDGFTRTRASLKAGLTEIPIEWSKGSKADALKAACGSNSSHGYRRTNRDKRRAVLVAIAEFGESMAVSKIAEICRVSHTYVHQLKRELDGGQGEAEEAKAEAAAEAAAEQQPAEPLPHSVSYRAEGSLEDDENEWGIDLTPEQEQYAAEQQEGLTECTGCGVPGVSDTLCEACGVQVAEPVPAAASPAAEPQAVDLTKEKIAKARTTLGQLVRLLDELGCTDKSKAAVEALSAILNKRSR